MYDPKFEKAVQRKMEELEFRPSESVWVNIEKSVSDRRRRRVIPFFWRLLIPALLVAAVGVAYYFGKEAGSKAVPTIVGVRAVVAETSAPVRGGSGTPAVVKTEGSGHARVAKKEVQRQAAGQQTGAMVARKSIVPAGEDEETSVSKAFMDQDRMRQSTLLGIPGIAAYIYRPNLEDQRIAYHVGAAGLKLNKDLIGLKTLSPVRRPWEAGFLAGAGIDRLNRQDLSHANNNPAYSMAPSFYSLSNMPVGKNYVSDVRPGASFYAGIYLQKALSDRWIFHTGVDLHYYSTHVSVGQQVSIVASPSTSLLNQRTLAAAPTPVVYTVGDQQDYTNRYYMLELPVSMQFRINRSNTLPLFLEGGGSVSRLMGASVVFYNPVTGLYNKNENVLNKTQFDISSALLIGLPFHGIRIQAGPEVQYGLTPISNVQGLANQHFIYTGMRLVVLPGRR